MRCVSVVIPSWNGADLLADNLPAALEAARRHPAPAEVIIVDDGSTDRSRDVVRALPEARLVLHERNRGFGAACLTGAREARHPLVFLLNSDARPEPDALAPLCRAFDAPDTFAASPLVLDEEGALAEVTINVPYLRRGRIRYRRRGTAGLSGAVASPLPWYTFFPLGGAILVHRERFLEIGGFDEMFHPFYYEDVDLGFRAWRRDWTCVVVPQSRVVHAGGGTIGRAFPRLRVRIVRKRNRVLFHCKNLTGRGDPLVHLAQQAFRSLSRLVTQLDPTELLGTLAAIPRLPAAFARRRAERSAARRSEAQILARIDERWRVNLAAIAAAADAAERSAS